MTDKLPPETGEDCNKYEGCDETCPLCNEQHPENAAAKKYLDELFGESNAGK